MKKDNFPLVPEMVTNFVPPALKPLSPNSSLLGLVFQKWASNKMVVIAENNARIFEAHTRSVQSQISLMMAMQTYSSNVQVHFSNNEHQILKNKHEQVIFHAQEIQENAKARTALAEAEKAELELEQFKKAMRDDSET
ncbi:MAG: hypothetical protein HY787_20280 [Deltaproteobacteria bacterium]|nr:hypothetical protein [Deltaproteobacteria bacterium]